MGKKVFSISILTRLFAWLGLIYEYQNTEWPLPGVWIWKRSGKLVRHPWINVGCTESYLTRFRWKFHSVTHWIRPNWWIRWPFMLVAFCAGLHAADVTPGYIFSPGEQNITHTKLNLATAGGINNTFYTGKALNSVPASSVVLLIYNPATLTYQQLTLDKAVVNNPDLIGTRSELIPVSGTNYVLIWTGAAYYKAQINNIVSANDQTETNTPSSSDYILVSNHGTNVYKVQLGNLYSNAVANVNLASLTNKSFPGANDLMLIYDAVAGSNKNIKVSQFQSPLLSITSQKGIRSYSGGNPRIDVFGTDILFSNTNGTRFIGGFTQGTSNRMYLTNFDVGTPAIFSNRWVYAYLTSDGTNYGGVFSTNKLFPSLSAPTNYYALVCPVLLDSTNTIYGYNHRKDTVNFLSPVWISSNSVGSINIDGQIASASNGIPSIAIEAWGSMGHTNNTAVGISLSSASSGQIEWKSAGAGTTTTIGSFLRVSAPWRLALADRRDENPSLVVDEVQIYWATTTNLIGHAINVSGFRF